MGQPWVRLFDSCVQLLREQGGVPRGADAQQVGGASALKAFLSSCSPVTKMPLLLSLLLASALSLELGEPPKTPQCLAAASTPSTLLSLPRFSSPLGSWLTSPPHCLWPPPIFSPLHPLCCGLSK